jgi:hypothetical protein
MSVSAADPYALAQLLLRKGLVSQSLLLRALQYYLLRRLGAGELRYRISRERAQMTLDDATGLAQNGLDLADLPAPPRGWVPYSPDVLALLDGETGQFIQTVERTAVQGPCLAEPGGVVTHQGRLYTVQAWHDERLPAIDGTNWPLDLFLPNGPGEAIAVADRASGKLLLIEPTLTKVTAELSIRPAGGRKAINVAYASATRTLYVTDGSSPDLIVIKLQSHQLERTYQDIGLAGNLQVSPDGAHLYMLIGHGDPAIAALRTSDLQETGRVLLPGKRFSDVDDPSDLMALSPNGRYLAVMTYQDEPALFTPILSLIDTTTWQLLSTLPMKKEEKPVGLAFSTSGSLPAATTFPQVLLDRELLSQEALNDALQELAILAAESAKPELDNDVALLVSQAPTAAAADVADIAKPDAAATQRLVESQTFKWGARPNMTQAEKQTLLAAANDLKAATEISSTNGTFVLNWLKDFLGD